LDPGNLGAILRTAYFLGVDAVTISTHQSAPLTPVALKASAGASENITLFSVSKVEEFLEESGKNGWQIYAAVAPPSGTNARKGHFLSTSTLNAPLDKSPVVLMVGGEGEGLRYRLQKQAHHYIGIGGSRAGLGGVDSLNVSVASALLTDAFLRPYTVAGRTTTESSQPPEERVF
jgi:21S rRNA (GM2251-2'-O)-methyltransferase